MRLVSLNTMCGRSLYPLMRFFRKAKNDTDIFCLQEVSNTTQEIVDQRHPDEFMCGTLFEKISSELTDFTGSFAAFHDDPHRMSLAIFWRSDLKAVAQNFLVYKPQKALEKGSKIFSPRKLQHLTVNFRGKRLLVANFHGLWNAGPKTDTPERIEQSRKVLEFMELCDPPKILSGDFNLLPNTESMRILEVGMKNLIKEFNIQSTRTPLYRHYDNPEEPNFADYMLVSPEIAVQKFEVLPDIVSDHSPLLLDFDLK